MNKYEGIFIFKPDLEEKRLDEEYAKLEQTLQKHDAKIEKSEKWGKKKLTFEINKFHDGFFYYLAFESKPEKIRTFTDILKIDNNILRSMITRKEA